MSRYQKIYSQIWHDEKFLGLSEDGKLLFLYCLTSPHSNAIGVYVLPKMYICADLKWSEKRLGKPFKELLVKGFIGYDETVNLILIINHLKHNSIENSNQLIGAIKIFSALPHSQKIIKRLIEGLGKGFTKGFTEQFIKGLSLQLPEGLPNSETETETETETTLVESEKITFDWSSLKFENLNGKLEVFKEKYPALDVEAEVRKMEAWIIANPKNKKSNWERFIVNWLTRAQDRAPRRESDYL